MVREIIVSEDAEEWGLEPRELLEHGGFREISSVDHSLDADLIEEVHDSLHIGQPVVGVADDANSH